MKFGRGGGACTGGGGDAPPAGAAEPNSEELELTVPNTGCMLGKDPILEADMSEPEMLELEVDAAGGALG